MTEYPDTPENGPSGLVGTVKLITVTLVVLVALLALLMILDVIPGDVFGVFAKKALLIASVLILASVAIALLIRTGK